jgi:hypothetical protein
MCRGADPYEAALLECLGAVSVSVFASAAIPAPEAVDWVCAQPNVEAIVFGGPRRRNIQSTSELLSDNRGERN